MLISYGFIFQFAKVHNIINNVEAFPHYFFNILSNLRNHQHSCPALWGHEQWQSTNVIGPWRTRFPCRKYTKNFKSFQAFGGLFCYSDKKWRDTIDIIIRLLFSCLLDYSTSICLFIVTIILFQ